jgi:hypothetical protein
MTENAADKLACVQRELKMREYVYPRRIEAGKMTAGKAEFELRLMRAIVEDYRIIVERERLI